MSKKPRFCERRPEYTEEPELPVWPKFLEKLLLAIIDANPPDQRSPKERAEDGSRQKRLDEALKALIGLEPASGNDELYLLHAAVAAADFEMPKASEVGFERQVLELPKSQRTKATSKRQSFKKHLEMMIGQSDSSREKRLKKFEKKNRTYLECVALFRDHPEEADMYRDLSALAAILKRWDLDSKIDPEALGMASLWGRK